MVFAAVVAVVFPPRKMIPAFDHFLDGITVGQTRDQVRKLLGEPSRSRTATTAPGAFGYGKLLFSVLGVGADYEAWEYDRDHADYFVFFASTKGEPGERSRTVAKFRHQHGVVY